MLVAVILHAPYRMQVFPDERTQDTRTRAVQDSYPRDTQQDGVVHEVHHRLYGFLAPHAAHVQILLEVQPLFVHRILRLNAQIRGSRSHGRFLRSLGPFQTVQPHVRAHHAESHDGRPAVGRFQYAHRSLALDPHRVTHYRRLFQSGRPLCRLLGLLCRFGLRTGLLFLPFSLAFLPRLQLFYLPRDLVLLVRLLNLVNLLLEVIQFLTHRAGT